MSALAQTELHDVRTDEMGLLRETGMVTGTSDRVYNLIWFTETCLSNALRLERYIEDARRGGDDQLAEFFARAQMRAVRGAEEAKALLGPRISG